MKNLIALFLIGLFLTACAPDSKNTSDSFPADAQGEWHLDAYSKDGVSYIPTKGQVITIDSIGWKVESFSNTWSLSKSGRGVSDFKAAVKEYMFDSKYSVLWLTKPSEGIDYKYRYFKRR